MAMTTSAILLATSAATSAYTQGQAAKMQGEYAKQQADANARMSELKAEDATKRGEAEALKAKQKANLMQGSQRASMAAQGIDVSSGSAASILDETAESGLQDVLTIRNNAFREAWGYRAEASQYRFEGAAAKRAGKYEARNTYLTGGLQVAGQLASGYSPAKKETAAEKMKRGNSEVRVNSKSRKVTTGSSYRDFKDYT